MSLVGEKFWSLDADLQSLESVSEVNILPGVLPYVPLIHQQPMTDQQAAESTEDPGSEMVSSESWIKLT